MNDEMKDFLRELAAASRTTQSLGMTSSTAYEEDEQDALLLPDQPEAEDERFFLGPVEELPQAPPSGALGEGEMELVGCGTMDYEDAQVARIMGTASDVAPPPLAPEFVFSKPVERCGDLEKLYKAFQLVLVDGKEEASFSMNGQDFNIQNKHTIQVLDAKKGILYGACKTNPEFDHLTRSDLLIWVSKVAEDKVLGYILNGWCYVAKKG